MIRTATRTLTGAPVRAADVTLGRREDGTPGVTVNLTGGRHAYVSFADPAVVRGLIADLVSGLYYLEAAS